MPPIVHIHSLTAQWIQCHTRQLMRKSSRPLTTLATLALATTVACGYVGLERGDEESDSVQLGGRSGERSGDSTEDDGDGGARASVNEGGDLGELDGPVDGSGGHESSGGSHGSGAKPGSGGTDGSGGALETPANWDNSLEPCSRDCPQPLLLYRRFEGELLGEIKEDAGAFVGVGDEFVHSGLHSLATAQGGPQSDAQITDRIDPVESGDLFYRAWIYVPRGAINHWIKVLAFNGSSEGTDVNMYENGSVEIYSQITSASEESIPDVVPVDEWFCLQVHAVVENDGQVELWINDKNVLSMMHVDTLPGTGVDNIVYGIAETGSDQTDATIYTDDIVASTKPVPCGPISP